MRGGTDDSVMLALHARRSAASIAAWAARRTAASGLAVVLTGTDLYRDIPTDAAAQRSLAAGAAHWWCCKNWGRGAARRHCAPRRG